MTESSLKQPDLIGRDGELDKLKKSLENAAAGKGSVTFIAGEAGIGKTRLVSELINEAEKKGAQIIRGWCLAESLEPLMPVKSALREAGLFHLISGDPPPLIVSAYLMNDAGLLIAKAEREELGLDPYIFGSMLKAVGSFVKDSMQKIDNVDRTGGLNSLGYKEYKIIIEEHDGLFLAAVTKGTLSEMLAGDMKNALSNIQMNFGHVLAGWNGDMEKLAGIDAPVSRLVMSGKYSGKHLIDDPKMRQESLFDNVLMGFQRISAQKPIVLSLDDLQWSDPTTLNLIHFLSKNTRDKRVLILGNYRPEEVVQSWDGKTHQLVDTMQKMSREDLIGKVELARLDQDHTRDMVGSALGSAKIEKELLSKIYKDTEGNPFFVLEVVKLLAEEKTLSCGTDGVWRAVGSIKKLDIPSKIYDVVKRRLGKLMEEQRKVLECASVIGDEFQSEVVGKIVRQDKLQLLENLSKIEKTHSLIHYLKDKYKFDHAKIREVLYNGISEELKREYHRVVGDTIAELHKDNSDEVAGELAHHYYEGRDERAAKFLILTGENAFKEYALEESMRLFSMALENTSKPCEIIQAHIGIVDVCTELGKTDLALENVDKGKKYFVNCTDEVLKNKLLRRETMRKRYVGLIDEETAIKQFNQIIESLKRLGDDRELAQAYISLSASYHLSCNYNAAIDLIKKKLEIDIRLDNKEKTAIDYWRLGWVLFRTGALDEAHEYLVKALCFSNDIGYLDGVLNCYDTMAWIAEDLGNYDEAIDCHEKMIEIWQSRGTKMDPFYIDYALGKIAEMRNESKEATEHLNNHIEKALKDENHYGIANGYYHIGEIHMRNGNFDDACTYFEQELQERRNFTKVQISIAYGLNRLGCVFLLKENGYKALEFFNQSLEIFNKAGNKAGISYSKTKIAEASILIGELGQAEKNAKEALDLSRQIGARVEEGMSHRALGMVRCSQMKFDEAISEFQNAEKILENVDRKEYAITLYEFGQLWKSKGEPAKSKEYTQKALVEFERMHMKFWIERCQKDLEALE
jgi:predicted ATPase